MYKLVYDSDNRKFCLNVQIKSSGTKKFRVISSDYAKPNSVYADREIEVKDERLIYLSFPVTPKKISVCVFNIENPKDESFSVVLIESPLKTYNIFIDEQTQRFLDVCIPFCQVAGFVNATPEGVKFPPDKDSEFTIRYVPVIVDYMSGQPVSTPARIGHNSGIIDAAKCYFDKYTIPMRVMIMLHEYGHKFRNPKIGLEIGDEQGADINGLYYYLGLGFSKLDCIIVFTQVFYKSQSEINQRRIRTIMNYISRFENGEFAQKNF